MSPTTLIFGGSGKVARHLTKQLASQGHTVHSIIRKPEQKSSIEDLGGKPIVASIEESSVEDMAKIMTDTKTDAVVWSAGAGGGSPERTWAVDRDGAIRSMDATAQAGVKRYIMVSAIDIRDRENKPEPEWYNDDDRQRSKGMWDAIGTYCLAKLAADKNLVTENGRRGLDYTIVRPTRLSEDAGRGKIAAGRVHLGEAIPREDVASVVIECMRNEKTTGLAFDCVGGEMPISAAIGKVADERLDQFKGFH